MGTTPEASLYKSASLQQGYFTSRQAKKAGYHDSNFARYVKNKIWIHEGRGIYRLAHYPPSDRPDLVYWSLWSCNKNWDVQGVFSHETALAIHNLSDLMPANYHISVPHGFRRRHLPKNLILHYTTLEEQDIWQLEGYQVTSPRRTIQDVILDETISEEHVLQTVSDGLENGMISLSLVKSIKSARAKRILTALKNNA